MRWWFIFPNDPSINRSKTIVGTGPFKLKSYVKGSGISVVRNPNYWQKGAPYLDGINFRFLKDASAQLANLFAGDVNYLHDVPVNLVDQVTQRASKSQLVSSGLFFHWWAPQLLTGPLVDPKVRQALLYAFDWNKMNQVAWAGKGINTRNPFTQTPYGIKDGPAASTYDPDKAKSLLAAANASGIKVPINVLQGSVQGPLEAQVMQQGFQAAGIDCSVNVLDSATWQKQAYTDRTHEGLIEDYGTLPFPFPLIGTYLLQPFVYPNPKDNSPSAAPLSYAALTTAKEAVADAVLRKDLADLQHDMLDEVATYHTFMSANYQVTPKNLKGLEVTKIGDVRFDKAYLA
jgi:peptide/nickel transport system substrate-binding protein